MTYFNSTGMVGEDLKQAIVQAEHQDAAVLAIFNAKARPLAPSDVWRLCEAAGMQWPLTSVRRSISCLTEAGALQRTDTLKPGIYGKPEHQWRKAA